MKTKVMSLPRLYPIIDRATLDARGMAVGGFARQLAGAGVGMVQYRDKVGSPQEVLRAATEIEAAFAGRECLFVMNDRADLAALLGWGVHVGQGDLVGGDARRVLGPQRRFPAGMTNKKTEMGVVGLSTHTEEQVRAACEPASQKRDVGHPDDGPDYIAIGPVFATGTKADAEPVVGLEGVRRARAATMLPLVAIGGITRENARSVVDAGADSVAVIGGVFVDGMPVREVVEDFLERLR
jgi:thiamine-phosphate pyrophosphorylase